jgi:hypothetical protein
MVVCQQVVVILPLYHISVNKNNLVDKNTHKVKQPREWGEIEWAELDLFRTAFPMILMEI